VKHFSEFLTALLLATLLLGPAPAWAVAPPNVFGLVTLTVEIDDDPSNSSISFTPSEKRTFWFYLQDNNAALNLTAATTPTVELITYLASGYKQSSMTLTCGTPLTSGIVYGTTAATFITSATDYGVISITSGTRNVITGRFQIDSVAIRSIH
jgi:hypothetical protein